MDEKMPKLYFCDPKKNTMCNQSSCFLNGGPCSHTTNIAFVDLDKESKAAEIRRNKLKFKKIRGKKNGKRP